MFVKTLEDDDYGYESDDSLEEPEVNKSLSDWLLNPEMNIRALYTAASSLAQQKKFEESINILNTVYRSYLKIHGEQHQLLGSCAHDIGVVHLRAGSYENALISFEKAVKVRKEVLGIDHPDVASSLVKIGITYLLLKRLELSFQNLDEALRISLNSLGHLHPSISFVYNNIGCIHVECQQMKDACSAFEKALEVQRAASVNEPENRVLTMGLATTLSNLGYLYASMGRLNSCGIVLREAILLQESILGGHQSTVLSTVDILASICIRNENYGGALRWYNSLLSRLREFRSFDDCKTERNILRQAKVFYKISRVHLTQNDQETCLQDMTNALQLLKTMNPEDKGESGGKLEKLLIKDFDRLEKEMNSSGGTFVWI